MGTLVSILCMIVVALFVIAFYIIFRSTSDEKILAEKLRSFRNLAHDLKTPVTLIKAPLTELERSDSLSLELMDQVVTARRNADRLLEMIDLLLNQVLEFQENDLKLERFHIQSYLLETLEAFRNASAQKGVSFVWNIDADIPVIWTDKSKLDNILGNLLSNSLKYTDEGSISVNVTRSGRNWVISIKDTGIGIPKSEQSKIFSDSFRAENARKRNDNGYGIGLMITRQLVSDLGGKISFKSDEGEGTEFILSLPMKYSNHLSTSDVNLSEVIAKPSDEEKGRMSVLVVDDEYETMEYLASSLSDEYEVYIADNGNTALSIAKERNPDIIISDLMMPLMAGDEMCRILKSSVETSHIPIIFLTAMSDRESIIYGLESGASDYVVKPFDMQVLRLRIRNILNERQKLRSELVTSATEEKETEFGNILDKEFMDKVKAVLEKAITDSSFQISDLCKEVGMSRTTLFNKIKSLTGHGPNDYIRIYRLNRAMELLSSHKYSIAEVSDMVGFSDPKYFSVCFKKQFGLSPSKV